MNIDSVADRKVNLTVEINSKRSLSGSLQLWLVEDGIVAPQMDNGKVDMNYVHNHVLRMSVNGMDGELVNLSGTPEVKTISFNVPDEYVIHHCHIVAIVYDNSGVLKTKCIPLQSEV